MPYRLEADGALKTIDSCLWGQVSPSPSAIHDNCLATLSKTIALRARILLDKRSFGRRDVANLCSANRPWVRPFPSAPTENCIMSVFTSTNNEALGKLLADLFPNVALSEAGVLLLAAQISNLGGRCARMHSRPIDHKRAKRTRHVGAASTAEGKSSSPLPSDRDVPPRSAFDCPQGR
jgi:hypothetical protein